MKVKLKKTTFFVLLNQIVSTVGNNLIWVLLIKAMLLKYNLEFVWYSDWYSVWYHFDCKRPVFHVPLLDFAHYFLNILSAEVCDTSTLLWWRDKLSVHWFHVDYCC